MKQIVINATEARKNFFDLLEQVNKGAVEVIIHKKGAHPLLLKKNEKSLAEIQRDKTLLKEISGSIKTSGYLDNEMEIAKSVFANSYKRQVDRSEI